MGKVDMEACRAWLDAIECSERVVDMLAGFFASGDRSMTEAAVQRHRWIMEHNINIMRRDQGKSVTSDQVTPRVDAANDFRPPSPLARQNPAGARQQRLCFG
mmetsp:Transcript_25007/g.81943  ORF Transcript_25007/g.81943 Transcript_25007/m.81943 type:complete len:102 (+) Transcript_25007:384-689(+)